MAGYGVDRAVIGLTFFTGSAGFALAGLSTGALIGRYRGPDRASGLDPQLCLLAGGLAGAGRGLRPAGGGLPGGQPRASARPPRAPGAPDPVPGRMLSAALRDRGVQFGPAKLALYVGLELSVGNWGSSYLVQTRALPHSLAGYTVSGYWLGLTLGRFLISPFAARAGLSTASLIYACLAGVTAAATLAWLAPAALPWLAGAVAQNAGMWMLLPFAIALAWPSSPSGGQSPAGSYKMNGISILVDRLYAG